MFVEEWILQKLLREEEEEWTLLGIRWAFEIPFHRVTSESFTKADQELLAYDMPITKIITENSVKDIQKLEDSRFQDQVDALVYSMEHAWRNGR